MIPSLKCKYPSQKFMQQDAGLINNFQLGFKKINLYMQFLIDDISFLLLKAITGQEATKNFLATQPTLCSAAVKYD